MTDKKYIATIITELKLLEAEFNHNKCNSRLAIKKAYLRYKPICGKNCKLEDPIYLDRILKSCFGKFIPWR